MNHNQPPDLASDRAQPEPRADWLAWSLHLVCGLLVGAAVGCVIARQMIHFGFIGLDQMLYVGAGVSLCCGAFTSFQGNRAWLMPSIFAAAEPPRTRKTRRSSIIIGMVGAIIALCPVAFHLFAVGRSTHESSSPGFNILLLLLAALPGFLLVHALRTGNGFWWFGTVRRDETPLIFWVYVLFNALAVAYVLFSLL